MFVVSLLILGFSLTPESINALCNPYNCTSTYAIDFVCFDFDSWSEINAELNKYHNNITCTAPFL
jgi:hypothetical protein